MEYHFATIPLSYLGMKLLLLGGLGVAYLTRYFSIKSGKSALSHILVRS